MPDYNLSQLGSRAFEQMVVALAHQEIGPGLSVFGDGKDGGREATYQGTIDWGGSVIAEGSAVWDGCTIFQAKFQVKPKPEPYQNAAWLQGEIGREISKWARAKRESTRVEFPDYLIFVTNIDLSPVAQTGGLDALEKFISAKVDAASIAFKDGLRLKGWRIWHADQLRSMLDAHQDIRWAYPALLTAGDVLATLLDAGAVNLGGLDICDPIREEILRSLKVDQWIRLGQAGGTGDEKLLLKDVAVDLPAGVDGTKEQVRAVNSILDLGDRVLRQQQPDRETRPNVVVVGGPGQGKSTVSQLISQAYRAAMLEDVAVGPDAREVLDGTRTMLESIGLALPSNRRWPVRVDLAKYSEVLLAGSEVTLLRWISDQVSKRTEVEIKPSQLRTWMRAWPWALVLDGLDEVPSADARRLLREAIDALLATSEDIDADLLLVVTTRPTGYVERFAEDSHRHLYLQSLPSDEASTLATRIVKTRFSDDPEMRARVSERMEEQSTDPAVGRLMQTPLQVTIMSMILEKYAHLPPDRFSLFDLYYQTVFDREVGKDIVVSGVLAKNRPRIDRLHEIVGLRLQVLAESADGAEAILPFGDLEDLVARQLRARGFEATQVEDSTRVLLDAAMTRLVLLVPKGDGVGFEVRTLQELMAARALTSATDERAMARLSAIAISPHWRNTWLLAAGRLLVSGERFEGLIVRQLRELDSSPTRLGEHFPAAPSLAADIYEDNLAFQRPNFERALVQIILRGVAHPAVGDMDTYVESLLFVLGTGHRDAVLKSLKAGLAGDAARRAAAVAILNQMTRYYSIGHEGALNVLRRDSAIRLSELNVVDLWSQILRGAAGPTGRDDEVSVAAYLSSLMSEDDLQIANDASWQAGMACLAESAFCWGTENPAVGLIALPVRLARVDGRPLAEALLRDELAVQFDMILATIPPEAWVVIGMVGAQVWPAISRRPVGHHLIIDVEETNRTESEY